LPKGARKMSFAWVCFFMFLNIGCASESYVQPKFTSKHKEC